MNYGKEFDLGRLGPESFETSQGLDHDYKSSMEKLEKLGLLSLQSKAGLVGPAQQNFIRYVNPGDNNFFKKNSKNLNGSNLTTENLNIASSCNLQNPNRSTGGGGIPSNAFNFYSNYQFFDLTKTKNNKSEIQLQRKLEKIGKFLFRLTTIEHSMTPNKILGRGHLSEKCTSAWKNMRFDSPMRSDIKLNFSQQMKKSSRKMSPSRCRQNPDVGRENIPTIIRHSASSGRNNFTRLSNQGCPTNVTEDCTCVRSKSSLSSKKAFTKGQPRANHRKSSETLAEQEPSMPRPPPTKNSSERKPKNS